MPLNRDAFTRYRLIDERLRRKPHPTLEGLIAHVSENLDKPVSKRTVQLDRPERPDTSPDYRQYAKIGWLN